MRSTLPLGLLVALAIGASANFHAQGQSSTHRMIRRQGAPGSTLPGPGQDGAVGVGAAVVSATTAPASAPSGANVVAAGASNQSSSTSTASAGDASSSGGAGSSGKGGSSSSSGKSGSNSGSNSGNSTSNGSGSGSKADTKGGNGDLTVLQFALTLENLESQFYAQAVEAMSAKQFEKAGFSSGQAKAITQQIAQQLIDEQTHVQILQQTISSLGATPFSGCSFNFDVAMTDPITFLSTARSIEAAGVGAYIGGAGLLSSKAVLTAAATILPIEARHQTVLNQFSGGSAIPQAFDIGMTPPQVLALAGGFLQDCTPDDLGLTANQPLSVIDSLTQSTFFTTGSVLNFQTSAQIDNLDSNSLSCQMLTGGAQTAIVLPVSQCIVPSNINGPVAVFLTSDATPLAGSVASQKSDNVVAGPALIFLDINQGEVLQQAFRNSQLDVKSLPSANLGFVALQPESSGSSRSSSSGSGSSKESSDNSNSGSGNSKESSDNSNGGSGSANEGSESSNSGSGSANESSESSNSGSGSANEGSESSNSGSGSANESSQSSNSGSGSANGSSQSSNSSSGNANENSQGSNSGAANSRKRSSGYNKIVTRDDSFTSLGYSQVLSRSSFGAQPKALVQFGSDAN